MSGDLTTRLDAPYGQQAETRQAAASFLVRKGHGDLLAVLGLVDEQEPATPGMCPSCGNAIPSTGVCRRGLKCRAEAAQAGAVHPYEGLPHD